jgi:anti-anti-sigma regulatory factor
MELAINYVEGNVPITVLKPQGSLDAATYGELIEAAQREYGKGARQMIIDLSDVSHMASAGIVAIHTITKLLHGSEPTQADTGWEATRKIAQEGGISPQKRLKLLSPQPYVDQLLEMVGFKKFIEVYNDLDTAVASFEL